MRYHCATPAQEGTKQKDGASKQNIAHHEQNVLGFQKIIKTRYCVNENGLKRENLIQDNGAITSNISRADRPSDPALSR